MLKIDNPQLKVGVLIGRFEVADLTDSYRSFLDWFLNQGFKANILILGNSPVICTKNNPLDYETRRLMIEEAYPGKFKIQYIMDQNLDEKWSSNLDKMLDDIRANQDVVIIGSREQFYNRYCGKFKSNFIEYSANKTFLSEAEHRKSLSKISKSSKEWRAGVVWATSSRYPTVYSTCDCAIFDGSQLERIYLARKPNENLLRFVGGFSAPEDNSFEECAIREAKEETGLDCNIIQYVCSQKIDDWRYRNETDKIITHLFAMTSTSGRPAADDDIAELRLCEFNLIQPEDLVPEHRSLFEKLITWRKAYLKLI